MTGERPGERVQSQLGMFPVELCKQRCRQRAWGIENPAVGVDGAPERCVVARRRLFDPFEVRGRSRYPGGLRIQIQQWSRGPGIQPPFEFKLPGPQRARIARTYAQTLGGQRKIGRLSPTGWHQSQRAIAPATAAQTKLPEQGFQICRTRGEVSAQAAL